MRNESKAGTQREMCSTRQKVSLLIFLFYGFEYAKIITKIISMVTKKPHITIGNESEKCGTRTLSYILALEWGVRNKLELESIFQHIYTSILCAVVCLDLQSLIIDCR